MVSSASLVQEAIQVAQFGSLHANILVLTGLVPSGLSCHNFNTCETKPHSILRSTYLASEN
jgi:hypothetical protein